MHNSLSYLVPESFTNFIFFKIFPLNQGCFFEQLHAHEQKLSLRQIFFWFTPRAGRGHYGNSLIFIYLSKYHFPPCLKKTVGIKISIVLSEVLCIIEKAPEDR